MENGSQERSVGLQEFGFENGEGVLLRIVSRSYLFTANVEVSSVDLSICSYVDMCHIRDDSGKKRWNRQWGLETRNCGRGTTKYRRL